MSMRHVSLHDTIDTSSHTPAHTRLLERTPPYNVLAHTGSQYIDYGLMSLHRPLSIHDARPWIIDALLRLILRIGHGVCRFPFNWQRHPIIPLWKDVIRQPFDCRKCKTRNRWCSIDPHLKDIITVIVCSTTVCKNADSDYRQPIWGFYVKSLAS